MNADTWILLIAAVVIFGFMYSMEYIRHDVTKPIILVVLITILLIILI
jgi:hypothetical protein